VLSVTGSSNTIVNPDLALTHTNEATASIEREMPGGISLRGLYVYKQEVATQAIVNTLRPFSAWNQQVVTQDPGADARPGTGDDGAPIIFYDYDPALRGSRFVANTLVNATDRKDSFNNLEVALRKRESNNWFAFTSFLATRNHKWLVYAVQSPNDNLFPLNETWTWSYRLSGGYVFPYGIRASTIYQADNGVVGQRTVNFATPSSGNLAIRVEPPSVKGPSRHVVNLRLSKQLRIGSHQLSLDLDTFNLFNTNVAWANTFVSGPTYNFTTDFAQSRVLRLGMMYRF
jgi:hypothetical protein